MVVVDDVGIRAVVAIKIGRTAARDQNIVADAAGEDDLSPAVRN